MSDNKKNTTNTNQDNESTNVEETRSTARDTLSIIAEESEKSEVSINETGSSETESSSTATREEEYDTTSKSSRHTPSKSKSNITNSDIGNAASTSGSTKEDDEAFCSKISNESSNISIMCRICYDDTLDEPIISPCKCKGTVGMMHKSCLEKWLAESNTNRCDLCLHKFETERTTKYTVHQSIYRWLRYPPTSFAFPIRDMRSDMITCLILIPFSFLLIYLCLFAAEYYNRQSFQIIPVARWTAISVMFMGIVIVLGFSTWIYLVLRYHSRVWYFWWQRETIVRIHVKEIDNR